MSRLGSLLAMALLLAPATAQAQQYPDHPVRMLVGFAAGSGPDIQARAVAAQLGTILGQQFFVENRLGANGTIATRAMVQSKPDGYTLLFTSSSIVSTPYVYKNLGYDVFTDIQPLATVGILDGLFMLVDSKSPYKNLAEFLTHAKKDRATYGSPGVGNGLHLAAELFSKTAGIKMQHIPYKGASEVMNGMLSGSVEVMFVTPPSVMGLLRDGRVHALAFTGTKPFPPFPNVPLMKDLLSGFQPIGSWGIFLAPAKTPPEIVEKLNKAIREALQVPAVATVMQRDGYMPDNRNVAEVTAFFHSEVKKGADAVKAAGIQPN